MRYIRLPSLRRSVTTLTGQYCFSSNKTADLTVLQYPFQFVDTKEDLVTAIGQLKGADSIAVDVEAFCTSTENTSKQLGRISLVQACAKSIPKVFIFDALTLEEVFVTEFKTISENENICKIFYDCRRDIEALRLQKDISVKNTLDLQLYYTALQWKLRSTNRRSGITHVLRQLTSIERQDGDSAVQQAMTSGNRPVWDVRPLPYHFLEYAAGDVRHTLLLHDHLISTAAEKGVSKEAVKKITQYYVEYYGTGKPVEEELDPQPAEVNELLLERYLGPGGRCRFCNGKGHTEAECFRKRQSVECSFCGQKGHMEANCFRKHPERNKCSICGQLGHSASHCFKANPCKHCGGRHRSENCLQRNKKKE